MMALQQRKEALQTRLEQLMPASKAEGLMRQPWLRSGVAGLIATAPMSVFMLLTQRFLPRGQQYALPPELLTHEMAERAHIRPFLSKRQIVVATLFSHFGYGMVMGAFYGPLEQRKPLPSPLQGALFGLLVWVGSYFALLPLAGARESGHREQGRRNLMMFAAHLIWGSSLGIVAHALARKE